MLALAVIASVAGCPTAPPSLPGPGLGSGGDTTMESAGTASTADATSMAADADAQGSAGSGTTGDAVDDTSGGGTDGGEPGPTCGASPVMCDMPSSYDGIGACDPFAQDCPAGQKCMPIATDPMGTWNSTACRPVDPGAGQLGEECTVDGEATSGMDDCDVGLMCWDVRDGQGRCVALCECGPAAPTCPAPGLTCTIANDGNVPLCLPPCDPLAPDCPAGEGCYPQPQSVGFSCAVDASGTTAPGDPCEFINACSPGQVCVNPTAVMGCEASAVGCCTAICDIADPMGCAGADATCVSWWGGEPTPEGCSETLGICDAF